MKKIVFALICLSATTIALAGVIVTKNDGNIEDVSNIVVSNTEVSFVENGTSKSLPIDKVSAVLYDDGRYEEVRMNQSYIDYIQNDTTFDIQKDFQSDLVSFISTFPHEAKMLDDATMYLSKYLMKCKSSDLGTIINKAIEAYVVAKINKQDGITAMRAYYEVIIDAVEKVKSSNKK